MSRIVLLLALVLTACGSRAVGEVSGPVANEPTEDLTKAIEGAVEQYRQAYEVHSPEALAALYSQDLDLSLTYQGRTHQGFTQVEAFITTRLAGVSKVRIVIKDLMVRELAPSVAIASASMESSIGDDESMVTEKGSLTLVFRKNNDKWMVVAEHFSYPTGPS